VITAEGNAGVSEIARAKVNLALHVTGRRADGYHLLDTLVVFPAIGDTVTCARAETSAPGALSLSVSGAFSGAAGETEDNLVMRAARRLAEACLYLPSATAIALEKRLPVAAGLGGGSADAAATLRALIRLWGVSISEDALAALALDLGADVPMCLTSQPARVRGIGEEITLVKGLPPFGILLVNPVRPVATPAVFRALSHRDNPPMPGLPDGFASVGALVDWLRATRNDFEPAARLLEPTIGDVLARLDGAGALLSRMSGSGATCFGLFADAGEAEIARQRIAAVEPDWWIAAGAC
jgi:4-diphosphocytidyl-2-C-methyl-D-erythritol kinase